MTNDKRKQHNPGAAGPGPRKDNPQAGGDNKPRAPEGSRAAAAGAGTSPTPPVEPAPETSADKPAEPSITAAGETGKQAGATPPTASEGEQPPTKPGPAAQEVGAAAAAAPKPKPAATASATAESARGSQQPPAASGGRPPGRGVALAALLVAVVAILLTLLLNYRMQAQQAAAEADNRADQALALARQAVDEAQGLKPGLEGVQSDLSERLATQGNALEALRQELAELHQAEATGRSALQSEIQTLALAQRGLGSSLEVVKETLASGGDRNAWTLSEVGYLLEIASHRLRFQEDVAGALQALVLARQRLAQVNELAFAPVQQMLDETVASLRGVAPLDRSALAQRIAALAAKAGELPLENESRTETLKEQAAAERAAMGTEVDTSQPGWWREALNNIWAETKRLIVVRRERRDGPPLIGPEEEYYLVQNLRLKLEAVRLAALAGDGASYQDSLALVLGWVERYFDASNERVGEVVREIKALQQVELHPYLPDVSRVLTAFNDAMAVRQPVRTLPTEPGPASDPAPAADGAAEGQS